MQNNPVIRIGFPVGDNYSSEKLSYGEGSYLYDQNGKKYVDFNSGLWNIPFGYANNHIENKINDQVKRLPYTNILSMVADIQITYAMRLVKFLGDFSSVLYTCSGSESIEAAIKTCRKYQSLRGNSRKKSISVFRLSYHGTSYGAMSVSGVDQILIDDYKPTLPNVCWIDIPKDINDIDEWIMKIDEHFDVYKDNIAGIILEPVIASGGIIIIPEEVLKYIQTLCKEKDILFVIDEVATGFGRTGAPFAFQKYNLQPDLVCLSKAVNNGYLPLGVLAYSNSLMNFLEGKNATIEHFSTQGGNLASVAAADAVLDLMENYDSYQVNEKGLMVAELLKCGILKIDKVEIRQIGLMIAIEFKDETMKNKLFSIIEFMRKRGILVYMFNNPGYNTGISLFPPFIMSKPEMEKNINSLIKILNKYIQ